MTQWIEACTTDDVDVKDVIRFDATVDGSERTFAIYRSPDNQWYCTDGLCTHEAVHLADGLVLDHTIECPMHNGRFNYTTGAATREPACENLATYPVKVEGDRVLIGV